MEIFGLLGAASGWIFGFVQVVEFGAISGVVRHRERLLL